MADPDPGSVHKFRPWLQDSAHPLDSFSEYGPGDVRDQIDAAEAFGGKGWMIWKTNDEPSFEARKWSLEALVAPDQSLDH